MVLGQRWIFFSDEASSLAGYWSIGSVWFVSGFVPSVSADPSIFSDCSTVVGFFVALESVTGYVITSSGVLLGSDLTSKTTSSSSSQGFTDTSNPGCVVGTVL